MGCIYRRKKRLADGTTVETGPYWIKYYRNGSPFCETTHTDRKSEAERELRKKGGRHSKRCADYVEGRTSAFR
jgi:hypothetical protein